MYVYVYMGHKCSKMLKVANLNDKLTICSTDFKRFDREEEVRFFQRKDNLYNFRKAPRGTFQGVLY